jgi:signal peptidase I
MTSETMTSGLCRLYSVLLYAYPAEFRRDYGHPMEQMFRDRCRELARNPQRLAGLRFATQVFADLAKTTVYERAAAVWKAGRSSGKRSSVTEWAGTILIYLFATTTLVQAYVVPTGSMEKNILVGDHILVDRVAYAKAGAGARSILPYRDLEHGDIFAFIYPEDVRQTYVKRVIGLPGDRIRIEKGEVIRNGRRLVEPYTQHLAGYHDSERENFPGTPDLFTTPRGRDMLEHHVRGGEVVVPPGMIFAMGDNRDNSADSRAWGFVPRENVQGKPLVVYWSYDAPTAELTEWSLNHVLDVATHFFTRTRWNRTFLVPRSQKAVEVAEDGGTR